MDWRSIITGRTGRIATGVLAAAAVTPAAAHAATSNPTGSLPAATQSCPTTPTFSQPFVGWGDQNWYTLAPGQAVDSFTAAGWTLTNGATDENQGVWCGGVRWFPGVCDVFGTTGWSRRVALGR